jgi:5-methylcytosine-specific restriction endonuclease McrA
MPLPSSKEEAIATGEKYYFTGKPCKRGHICKRYRNGQCQECRTMILRKWQRENWGKVLEYSQEYRESMTEREKEEYRLSRAAWYQSVKDEYNARRRANRDRNNEWGRDYYRRNCELIKQRERNKRAKKRASSGQHTPDDVREQFERQNGRCYWCCVKCGESYHVDHVVPLSRGGSNGKENIVVACRLCNLRKNARAAMDFVLTLLG